MTEGEFTVVPVLSKFGDTEPVGMLRIRTDALPPMLGFVFALGFEILQISETRDRWPTSSDVTDYRLREVAIQYDEAYIEYLRSIGKI